MFNINNNFYIFYVNYYPVSHCKYFSRKLNNACRVSFWSNFNPIITFDLFIQAQKSLCIVDEIVLAFIKMGFGGSVETHMGLFMSYNHGCFLN